MSIRKSFLLGLSLLAVTFTAAQANINLVTHPLEIEKPIFSTGFSSHMSHGSGMGIQAMVTHRLNQEVIFDGGFAVNSGKRARSFFLGSDFRLFPDYGTQPRVSVKGLYEYNKEFDSDVHRVGFAPTVSKGMSLWGHEAYPFVALPLKLVLDSDHNTFTTASNLAMGMTGRLPVEGYRHLSGFVEGNVNLRNSYNSLLLGISMPLK